MHMHMCMCMCMHMCTCMCMCAHMHTGRCACLRLERAHVMRARAGVQHDEPGEASRSQLRGEVGAEQRRQVLLVVQVLVEDGHRGGVGPLGAGAEDGVDRDTKDGVDRL